jgi:thiamine-phosphate pyrophosphorylase
LLPVCRQYDTPLLVNDRCDVVLAVGLDGVHLAQASIAPRDARALLGAEAIIGVSCHDRPEVDAALGAADYVAFGPIFSPKSKAPQRPPLGMNGLAAAVATGMAVYALGGVDPGNAADLRRSGAHGLAVIGAGLGADDPGAAVASLWRAWHSGGPG